MKRFMLIFAALALTTFTTFGGDTNAAGSWKWALAGQNGETILKLKQDGEKLTGSYTNQFGKAEITDGSLKDGDITFKVKRELNGQAFLIKYSGKLSGDKITGKCEFDVNGETRALKWEAKRDTTQAAAAASGNWSTVLILGDGNRIEGTLKLKQDGDTLTGATVRNENETQIQDGKNCRRRNHLPSHPRPRRPKSHRQIQRQNHRRHRQRQSRIRLVRRLANPRLGRHTREIIFPAVQPSKSTLLNSLAIYSLTIYRSEQR